MFFLILILIGCKDGQQGEQQDAVVDNRTEEYKTVQSGIKLIEYVGDYEPALKIKFDIIQDKIVGVIDYKTTSRCTLDFYGYAKDIKRTNQMIISIKGFMIDSVVQGTLYFEKEAIKIQFEAPAYCQKILDFRDGEVFFKQ